MKSSLQTILELSYSFSRIDRDIYYPNRQKPENDSEHCFQLVLLAWYIIEKDKLNLDSEKVFKLCMAHDLVEIYAGDVPLWGRTGHEEKGKREREALGILKKKLKNTKNMTDVIEEYNEGKTEEAKLACGLDKLLPFLNQLNTKGRVWKAHNVTSERALAVLEKHAKISGHLVTYFDEHIKYLKKHKKTMFIDKQSIH